MCAEALKQQFSLSGVCVGNYEDVFGKKYRKLFPRKDENVWRKRLASLTKQGYDVVSCVVHIPNFGIPNYLHFVDKNEFRMLEIKIEQDAHLRLLIPRIDICR